MDRRLLAIAFLPAVLSLFLAGAVGAWGARTAMLPPPFAYLDANGTPASSRVAEYKANNGPAFCPGQSLEYTVYLAVTDVPVVIEPFFKIINLRTGRAVKGFGPINSPVPYASPVRTSARLFQLIPADLPPGDYAFEVVARAQGREFNGFRVLFTVRGDCFLVTNEHGR